METVRLPTTMSVLCRELGALFAVVIFYSLRDAAGASDGAIA